MRVAVSRDLLLRGGRVVDPSNSIDRIADVRVQNGVIAAVGDLDPEPTERTVDVDGLVVAPGLIDVHVHLREPGQGVERDDRIWDCRRGGRGFTTIFCMPNTDPALDSVVALEELKRRDAMHW